MESKLDAAAAAGWRPLTDPIGTAGEKWGDDEIAAWRAKVGVPKRSYKEEVLDKLEALRETFDVEQYGALPVDEARYPLFCIRTKAWDPAKPNVLVTGGVHGYETSGVQGALLFAATEMDKYGKNFNILVCPCVSPWGYEAIQRWNPNAVDPNRSFHEGSPSEESGGVVKLMADMKESHGAEEWQVHIDLHETTDTDESEFRPAKAARDGEVYEEDGIPDGFYLVGDSEKPQEAWHTAMIDSVRKVTHIAPPDDKGLIIGAPLTQEGVIVYPAKDLHLCSSVANAAYATTTEVYPDSATATEEECNRAQVACLVGGLDFVIAKGA